jgi:four helix bundle protein
MSDESKMPYAKAFWELVVYQRARELQGKVFEMTKMLPRDQVHSLTDQIRRSSRSIGAQIAEAWAKREYVKHFASKLSDAQAENFETQHWLIAATDAQYWARGDSALLFDLCNQIGRMLTRMSDRADEFCTALQANTLREDSAEWFSSTIDPFSSKD